VNLRRRAAHALRSAAPWLDTAPARGLAAAGIALLLAAAVLIPGLGDPGLWEPHERGYADRVAPPAEVEAERAARQLVDQVAAAGALARPSASGQVAAAAAPCLRAAPADALARSLTPRALRAGRDHLADSDGGRRAPLALLAILCVLATAGTALRLVGARAALATAIALLAMPLLVLQARLLTSEIGTATGAALVVYGLAALARPRGRGALARAADGAHAAAALAAGAAVGFLSGGALLGLVVPLGAFALAAGVGLAARRAPDATPGSPPRAALPLAVAAVIAAAAALALIALLAAQLYDLRDPEAGLASPERGGLRAAIAPAGCWSWALGGVWRPDDDLRYIFDSTFEVVAYGTFPWGLLGVLAAALLLRDPDPDRRITGALALAWAAGAWIATEAFQRKVGPAVWAGFPGLALAVGAFLAPLGAPRRRPPSDALDASGALLVAVAFAIGAITLGKDMSMFADRVASILADGAVIAHPKAATIAGVPAHLWPMLLGGATAAAAAVAIALAESPARQRACAAAAAVAVAGSVALAALWAHAWHPAVAHHLSTKPLFDRYRALRAAGDPLVILGDLGLAPRAYAGAAPAPAPPAGAPRGPAAPLAPLAEVPGRDALVAALRRPERVFAIAPRSELCALHREVGEGNYAVLAAANPKHLLLSNRAAGAPDHNPLVGAMSQREPAPIRTRPEGRIVFDDKIELLGWDLPRAAALGDRFEVTLYFKVLAPVGATWKILAHFDGATRFQGDHPPIDDRCPTSSWQAGDYVIDRFTVTAGRRGSPRGPYALWTGFWAGSAPSYRNLPVSLAPPARRDGTDRVKLGTILVE
jgi:hypothetical protein